MDWSSWLPPWLVIVESIAALLLGSGLWVAHMPPTVAALTMPFDWVVYGIIALVGAGWLTGTMAMLVWLARHDFGADREPRRARRP